MTSTTTDDSRPASRIRIRRHSRGHARRTLVLLATFTLALASGGATASAADGTTPAADGTTPAADGTTPAGDTAASPAGGTAASPTGGTTSGETTRAAIAGTGRMDYPAPGNFVYITVNARAEYAGSSFPERSWGSFTVYHRIEQPGQEPLVNWGVFEVGCLTTGGPIATVTGTMVRAHPETPWEDGFRTGLSFYVPGNGDRSLIGIAGAPGAPLTPCMAPAPDAYVIEGGYHLTGKHEEHPGTAATSGGR